jgi:fructose-bisphosphate aldolase class I
MADAKMREQMANAPGFIAALDQSGGSTPGALKLYGVAESEYHGETEMFAAVHAMRVRIMTAPSFARPQILAAILFEATMDGEAQGVPVPTYLWKERGIVPFVKCDKGPAEEKDGASLLKPIPDLDALLERAAAKGVYGTKMRSIIHRASRSGVAANVAQQFEIGEQIARHGLMPILEPEVSIKAPDKAEAETMLRDEILAHLDKLAPGREVMLKLTIPSTPDFFAPLIAHPKVLRVVALSGGYSRAEACAKLAHNPGMIASFSRAFAEGLRKSMTDAEFDAALAESANEIYRASTVKAAA